MAVKNWIGSILRNFECGKICSFEKILLVLPRKPWYEKRMSEREVIAKNLKSLRETCNFTQDHVASFLGITRSAYANYEAGGREVPFAVLERLTDLYGCDMYELYSEDGQVVKNMLATAFRIDHLTPEDMRQLAAFKSIVKHSLKMDILLAR